jgi:hypothetical protein
MDLSISTGALTFFWGSTILHLLW